MSLPVSTENVKPVPSAAAPIVDLLDGAVEALVRADWRRLESLAAALPATFPATFSATEDCRRKCRLLGQVLDETTRNLRLLRRLSEAELAGVRGYTAGGQSAVHFQQS